MFNSCVEARVPFLQNRFAPGFFQITTIQILCKMFLGKLTVIKKPKDQSVCQNWLKNFCQIQRERKTPESRLVEK